ncbi:hypothetical protein FBU31_005832 [Coemansia sp. 'formosensis']|nr:hypothetical protein FBU31_005832 [Coemansia sp. 'formosensis']
MEAAAPQVNGQLSSSQLPSLAPISGITDTAADNVADHEAQANSEPDRPRMTTMTTDSTSSTVSTPVLDSSLRHESDVEEPEVEAVAPSSEPLIISGLFANEGAAAGLRLNIPCGEITADTLDAPQSQPVPESPSHHSDNSGAASDADDPDAMDVVNIDAENDADDDESDVEIKDAGDIEQAGVSPSHMLSGELTSTARNTPEACVEPAAIQGEKEEESRRHTELLDHSQRVEDGDAFWRIEDVEEPLKLGSEHTPRNGSHQGRAWSATSQTFKSPARMANGNARTPEAISKSQPRATRSRRASTARVVSMCQRLLTLHKLGDNDGRLGLQLGDGLLSSRTVLGSDALESSRLASHDFSNAPSPARRAQFSGAMRVFGDNAPEMNDSERLAYLRKLKGLMVDTSLTPKQAMAILYRCTGDWVIARKFIISGEASVPSGRMWSAEDDQALQQGMDLDKMEELRQQKGNVEVYRRLQFLNTFHGPKE